MAYFLPFFVFLIAALLLLGKLRHIGTGTAIFSLLIYINMCVLNSSRFIDTEELRYGFRDIADFYRTGVEGYMGGAVGMEIGSLLVKFFGKPGLIIIALAVMIISIFMVANSPISRLAGKIGRKREENRILKELEADERRRLSESQIKEALTGDPTVSASVAGVRNTAADICTPGDSARTRSATERTTAVMFDARNSAHLSLIASSSRTCAGQFVRDAPANISKRVRQPSQKQWFASG